MNLLATAIRNKHTTGAGLAFFGIKGIQQIGLIWWPQHKDKIDATANALEGLVGAYGLIMAGDGSNSQQAHNETKQMISDLRNQVAQSVQTGDTTILTNQAKPPTEPPKVS